MRIKSKPKPPKRKSITLSDSWCDTLEALNAWAESNGFTPQQVEILSTYDGAEVVGIRPETDEEFAVRVSQYQRKLEAWNKWYEENKPEVDAALETRKEIEAAKKAKQKTTAQLRKEVARLEKKLRDLEG